MTEHQLDGTYTVGVERTIAADIPAELDALRLIADLVGVVSVPPGAPGEALYQAWRDWLDQYGANSVRRRRAELEPDITRLAQRRRGVRGAHVAGVWLDEALAEPALDLSGSVLDAAYATLGTCGGGCAAG